MDIVKIKKINEVYNKIYCEPWLAKEIDSFFTFKVPGYQYMPKYKSGMWNGDIHIFNLRNQLLYGGLNVYLEKFCEEREYEIKYLTDFSADEFSIKEAQDFISSLAIPLIPRDYQIEAFVYAIRNRRALLLSPTASGKSLIIYLISRWINLNTLLIVPTTSLVHQMYTDFESYGYDSKTNCHMIYSGEDKNILKPVVITTWQSIFRLPKSWFDKFDLVIGDEAHLFQAKSLVSIMEKLEDCQYRYGFTGTLDGTQCFDGNTLINTANGKKKIKHINKNDKVLTFNENNKFLEYKPVLNKFNNGVSKKMLKIKTLSGEITVTPNHEICTKDGWKAAKDLSLNDEIICIS